MGNSPGGRWDGTLKHKDMMTDILLEAALVVLR
jgi:hypothetical protein